MIGFFGALPSNICAVKRHWVDRGRRLYPNLLAVHGYRRRPILEPDPRNAKLLRCLLFPILCLTFASLREFILPLLPYLSVSRPLGTKIFAKMSELLPLQCKGHKDGELSEVYLNPLFVSFGAFCCFFCVPCVLLRLFLLLDSTYQLLTHALRNCSWLKYR